MAFGTRVNFEPVREIDATSILGTYVALGTPLVNHIRLISFNNSTTQDVYISFDGIDDHLRLSDNSFKLLDLSSNKVRNDGLFIAVGTQIFVKYVSTTSTTGNVWAETLFAEGGT